MWDYFFIAAVIFIVSSFILSRWIERKYKILDKNGEIFTLIIVLMCVAFIFGLYAQK
jgi:hypothetical protein